MNSEELKEYQKKYLKKYFENPINRQRNRDSSKVWRSKNKKYEKDRRKKYYLNNVEKERKLSSILANKKQFGGNRIKVLGRDNYTCQRCFKKKEEVKRMCVHHIDGKGRNSKEKNNRLDNLITLCVSCHMALHRAKNYAGKNTR